MPSHPVRALLLDIEGTTTPIAFVYDVLFPYARRRLRPYLQNPRNSEALCEPLRLLREERSGDPDDRPHDPDDGPPQGGHDVPNALRATPKGGHDVHEGRRDIPAEYVEWLMDQDRKSPGLKLLQGLIWDEGYRRGELKGEVFADVPEALQRCREAGTLVATYSSGSVLAQRLLFGSTRHGDLTGLIARFFDTRVGAKTSADSYRRIAGELAYPADQILFVSDVTAELDAARSAGFEVRLCERPGNRPQPQHAYDVVHGLDEIATP